MAGLDVGVNEGYNNQRKEYLYNEITQYKPELADHSDLLYGDLELIHIRSLNDGTIPPIIRGDPSSFAPALVAGKAPVRKGDSVVYVKDYYQSNYVAGVSDIKSAFDSAANAAVEGATIQFEAGYTHFLSAAAPMLKSLNIDGNGSGLICDPTPGSGTAGVPVFYFKGGISATSHSLSSSLKNSVLVTLSNIADSSNYAAGDHVIISDSTQVRPWDYGGSGAVPTYPEGYIGREEITTVKSVNISTGVIVLLKPVEWDYVTTPVITKITKMLQSPSIYNFKYVHEIDPGGLNNNLDYGPAAPHIIHGQYCHTPVAHSMYFEGWNKHCVNFHRSINPQIHWIAGRNPYRPESGGHGYLTRFDRTLGGHIQGCYSEKVRHHTDYVMAVDGHSSNNVAVSHISCAYMGHGLGAKRIHSDNDTVYDSGVAWGWAVGNLAFGPDYDFVITNPTYNGTSNAIVCHAKAENVTINNPDCRSTTRAILITTGAKNITINLGTIEIIGNSSTSNTIFVRAKAAIADPYGLRPYNIRVLGTRLKGSNPQVYIDSQGDVELNDIVFEDASSTLVGSAVNLIEFVSAPASLKIHDIRMTGIYAKGVNYPVAAPVGEYTFGFLDSRGHTDRAVSAPVAANMKFALNSASNNGSGLTPWNITGDIAAAITGTAGYGAVIIGNSPAVV